jgi:GMP synthase-like glutamine amidotransferase
MKRVLVLTHVENEGPGTLGFFLNYLGVRIRTIRLYEGENLPGDASKYDAIISMGGPMNVDEEDRYPFLSKEVKFLKRAIDSNVPVIGICLGAQLITKACCAKVERMAEEERGWKRVFLTDEGRRDILFQGLPGIIQVFQWHGYTFDIPYGGELIATAKDCPNQAFRYRNAYGLQFHIEVTGNMIREWFNDHPELEDYMDNYQIIEHEYYAQAKQIYANFMWFADLCRQSSDRHIKSGK